MNFYGNQHRVYIPYLSLFMEYTSGMLGSLIWPGSLKIILNGGIDSNAQCWTSQNCPEILQML